MFSPRALYGVIGDPIGQSLSPSLHNSAFQALGLEAAFLAWHITPEKLADFVLAARTLPIAGTCVTIPHKEQIIPLLDDLTAVARYVGAVNTLFWNEGRLLGHNTDMEGFLAPLKTLQAGKGQTFATALVLGAGGAARAVLAGMLSLGSIKTLWLCARRLEQAQALADSFAALSTKVSDLELVALPWAERHHVEAELIINTTPVGMKTGEASVAAQSPFTHFAKGGEGCLAYDLIYQDTPFLHAARAAGWPTLNGEAMFAAQGAAQFRLWTGREMPAEAFAALAAARNIKTASQHHDS